MPSEPVRRVEIVAALSLATDLAIGQPVELALRSCALAVSLAETAGMDREHQRRFVDGRIAESWFNFDMLTLLQQVGAIPSPEHAAH